MLRKSREGKRVTSLLLVSPRASKASKQAWADKQASRQDGSVRVERQRQKHCYWHWHDASGYPDRVEKERGGICKYASHVGGMRLFLHLRMCWRACWPADGKGDEVRWDRMR